MSFFIIKCLPQDFWESSLINGTPKIQHQTWAALNELIHFNHTLSLETWLLKTCRIWKQLMINIVCFFHIRPWWWKDTVRHCYPLPLWPRGVLLLPLHPSVCLSVRLWMIVSSPVLSNYYSYPLQMHALYFNLALYFSLNITLEPSLSCLETEVVAMAQSSAPSASQAHRVHWHDTKNTYPTAGMDR